MRPNELMIGDWVSSPRLRSHGGGNYLHQLERIDLGCEYDSIPLTEEILKANGWKGTALYWSKHKVPFEISILVCRTTPFINGHGRVCYYIKYVHDLQHALRLCELHEISNNFVI